MSYRHLTIEERYFIAHMRVLGWCRRSGDQPVRYMAMILLAASVSACKVHTSVVIRNESGETIEVLSEQTKEVTTIADGNAAAIDHTVGRITIHVSSGATWNYDVLAVPDLYKSKFMEKKEGIFETRMRIYLLVDDKGRIYLLPPGGVPKDKAYAADQPEGFPLVPE